MEHVEDKNTNVLPQAVRLNRFIAMAGISSRRKAEELILSGEVTVNKKVVTDLSTKVSPSTDHVAVSGRPIVIQEHLVYILLNKPKDYITTARDEKNRKTVFDLVQTRERIFPVGRLDRNTTGVLLFTNDGELAYRLMHPSHQVQKSYHVELTSSVEQKDVEKIKKGVHIEGGKTAPARVDSIPGTKNKNIVVTIHEGRNRQVRRMLESLGYEVKRLDRIEYAGLTADGLRRGGWRYLSKPEERMLKKFAGMTGP
ncbi:MAG TPA: pseudouridine synthase [Bacteroidota bacterium]|nr:pseudouridine synthase [Bacteroidota bacterium]